MVAPLRGTEAVALVAIAATMLWSAKAALREPPPGPGVHGHAGAVRSAALALGAVKRELAARTRPEDIAAVLRMDTQAGPVHRLLRQVAGGPDQEVEDVRLRAFSLRLLPGDREAYLEVTVEATDDEGHESVRQLDVSPVPARNDGGR